MNKLYFDDGSINICFLEDKNIDVYEDEEKGYYVDDDKLDDILNNVSNEIFDEYFGELSDIGIYLNINFEFDKTIWNDYDCNYVNW